MKPDLIYRPINLKLSGLMLLLIGLMTALLGIAWSVEYKIIWLIVSSIIMVAGAITLILSLITRKNTIDHETVKLIIDANKDSLHRQFPNIKRIYPAFHIGRKNGQRTPCVDICLFDANTTGLPDFIYYRTNQNQTIKVKTRLIKHFKNAKPQLAKGEFVAGVNSQGYLGTIGCFLSSGNNPGQTYLLTCNHVLTGGSFNNPGNIGSEVDTFFAGIYQNIGIWAQGQMNNTVDAAIVSVDASQVVESNNVSLPAYDVDNEDCSVTQVELIGAISGVIQAYIIHFNQSIDIDYDNQTLELDNLITLSIDNNPANFTPATQKGDSGALVYHVTTRQPVAMVIGANDQFTFALPIAIVLNTFPDLNLTINN